MKQALVLGCSHASGAEMAREPGVVYPDVYAFEAYGRTRSYPVKIAQALGYNVDNQAISGGSNDAMFRIFETEHTNYDIVIACWSGYNRTEVWNSDSNSWVPFSPGIHAGDLKAYQQQWVVHCTDDATGRLNKIKNIVALNALAQAHGIPVINIDSFWPVPSYAWPSNVHWPVSTDFWDWCTNKKYPRTDWGHYFEPAHQAFADYVLENLAG